MGLRDQLPLVVVGLLLTVSPPVGAQGAQGAQAERVVHTRLETYDGFNRVPGLPSQSVAAVWEDDNGFAWFGMLSGGLAFWNGAQIVPVAVETKDVTALGGTANVIWVGTEAGLLRVAADHKQLPGVLLGELGVIWIRALDRKTVAIGTTKGVYTVEEGGEPVERSATASLGSVTAAAVTDQGELWLGSQEGNVTSFDRAANKLGSIIKVGNPVTALQWVGARLWIGTDQGARWVEPAASSQVHSGPTLSAPAVTAIADDGESVWFGTSDGLNRLRRGASEVQIHRSRPWDRSSLSRADITEIYARPGSPLLVGSLLGANVLSISKDRVTRYVTSAPFRDGVLGATSIAVQDDGTIWGGQMSALFRIDRKKGETTFYDYLLDADGEQVQFDLPTGMIIADGQLWFGDAQNGLVAMDLKTMTARQVGADLGIPRVMRIARQPDGVMWLATWGLGLVRFDPAANTATAQQFGDSEQFRFLYDVLIDPAEPGVLWVSGARSGLGRYRVGTGEAGKLEEISLGVKAPTVYRATPAGNDTLWLATDGQGAIALSRRSGTVTKTLKESDGLGSNNVYDVLVDGRGVAWIINPKTVSAVLPDGTVRRMLNAENNSEIQDENTQGTALSAGKEILFGTTRGLFALDPQRLLEADLGRSRLVFTSFRVKGNDFPLEAPIWTNPSITLRHSDAVFSVQFAGVPGLRVTRPEFRYRLKGLHDDWISGDQGYAAYSNLDGGDYVLSVQARLDSGEWSEPRELKIQVLPPWWKTGWAYAGYGALGLLLFGSLFSYQVSKIRRLQQARRLDQLENDLSLTAAVQEGFLPKVGTLEQPLFAVAGYCQPAEKCSGDWWWYELDDASLTVVVGDVTGHGVASAMLTAAVAATFRTSRGSIDERLRIAHEEVRRVAAGELLFCGTVISLDLESGEFTVFSSGGLPVLLLTGEQQQKAQTIVAPGTPLGSSEFHVGKTGGVLKPGDRLLSFTDGIVEAMTTKGSQVGMRWIVKSCGDLSQAEFQTAVPDLVSKLRTETGALPQEDDWTVVLLERR